MSESARKVTFSQAVFVFLFLIISLITTIVIFKGAPHVPILAAAIVAAVIAVKSGYKWEFIEEGIAETIKMSTQAILILLIIGTIIGTWILGGIVPTMIYYGLRILSPGIFLIATCLICSIIALATGSSWSTAGTVGIALMGVGMGLGISPGIVAGAIISGSYFGDKMSPLSDTTNLAPAMAGADIFDHIKHMIYTTGPSYAITLIIYGLLGIKFAGKNIDANSIDLLLNTFEKQFTITPILLIPPVLVIIMVIKKIPAMPGLIGSSLLGAICAAVFQGAGLSQIIAVVNGGYSANTGVETVDKLINRGGIQSMMWTVSLVLIALSFAGIVEKTGMISIVAEKILKAAKSDGSLITATIFTCIFTNFTTGVQYVALVLPGRMYKDVYVERGLHPKNLSRTLEDSGTLVAPLVPWSTDAAFLIGALGVGPMAYAPYAILNLVNPIVAIILGYTGWTIEKIDKPMDEKEKISSLEA
ncbi:Na+/H+ antiporter NhaC [Maledivibacter halophilus]|uniref:Transporter, NhaC family (TC 2.A.35) n=1 Tax=Maledivibacter halophilus TaxID=36842 RepID=A0A1T5M4I7_9FIRM|nr:Na+/H+ antiporter NhaC [Maledivibacter halophilus]SKC83167.1 transporter, NhaC family (TC 2.A.35) [Maledivibacter halophilus]